MSEVIPVDWTQGSPSSEKACDGYLKLSSPKSKDLPCLWLKRKLN